MENVIVKIENLQRMLNTFDGSSDEPELIEVLTHGRFSKGKNIYTLEYEEVDGNKNYVCLTTLEFIKSAQEKSVKITKTGRTNTLLIVQENKCNDSWYNTEYGGFKISVWGESINSNFDNSGGIIEFSFKMDLNSVASSINYIKVSIFFEKRKGEHKC